jgi:hypothetical protein
MILLKVVVSLVISEDYLSVRSLTQQDKLDGFTADWEDGSFYTGQLSIGVIKWCDMSSTIIEMNYLCTDKYTVDYGPMYSPIHYYLQCTQVVKTILLVQDIWSKIVFVIMTS